MSAPQYHTTTGLPSKHSKHSKPSKHSKHSKPSKHSKHSKPTNYASIVNAVSATAVTNSGPQSTESYNVTDQRRSRESENNDGGFSFDEIKTTLEALDRERVCRYRGDSDSAECFETIANRAIESYIQKVATIGTNQNTTVCTGEKMSQVVIEFIHTLIGLGKIQKIIEVIQNVYNDKLTKSLDHVIFLIVLLTTISDAKSGSAANTSAIRSAGYSLVKNFRTGSHILQWAGEHIQICKATGSKGTGAGFRNAVKAWFMKYDDKPLQLEYQVIKYQNRNGVTMKDLLCLCHIKPTSKTRGSAKKIGSSQIRDCVSPGMQFVLAHIVDGFAPACTELDEVAGRKLHMIEKSGSTKYCKDRQSIEREILDALECVAYAAGVQICKSDNSDLSLVIKMIDAFGITTEMVNNSHVNDIGVKASLASRDIPSISLLHEFKVDVIASHITEHQNIQPFFSLYKNGMISTSTPPIVTETAIQEPLDLSKLLEDEIQYEMVEMVEMVEMAEMVEMVEMAEMVEMVEMAEMVEKAEKAKMVEKVEFVKKPLEREWTMPYTRCIRSLNGLGPLFDRMTYPLAPQMKRMISDFLVNPSIVERSGVHPFSILTALATYKAGHSFRGSQTWEVLPFIVDLLDQAQRVSFQNCKPHGKITAHMIDGSGSMRGDNSTSIPFLNASEVCAFMVSLSMEIENVRTHPERFYAGVFQGWQSPHYTYQDITNQLTNTSTLSSCQNQLAKIPGGMTNMMVAFDYYRHALAESLRLATAGDRAYSHVKSFLELPGFIELFQMWTDNEINSGKKIPECLDEYLEVQRQAIWQFPYTLCGKKIDPDLLFRRHCAKLAVVCTQATKFVVGDPFDTRIICVSGFDASGPQRITDFIQEWDTKTEYGDTKTEYGSPTTHLD
jgi:hypothetical protein